MALSSTISKYVAPVVRALLALALIYVGVRGWADGYGMLVITIGGGILTAELVGYGLSPSQADTAIADLIATLGSTGLQEAVTAAMDAFTANVAAQKAAKNGGQANGSPASPGAPP